MPGRAEGSLKAVAGRGRVQLAFSNAGQGGWSRFENPDRVHLHGKAHLMNDTSRPRRVSVRGITIVAATAAVLIGGAAAAAAADDGGNSTSQGSSTSASSSAPSVAGARSGSGDGSATPPAPKPHLDGTVTSVTSSSILITDPEGFTRTIHLSGDTTYGDGVSLPVAVGERIHAEGTVDTDGTSLAATVIASAPEPPAPGAAGPGGGPAGPPAPPADGSAPTPPAPPTDDSLPAPPSGAEQAPSTTTVAPTS